MDLSLQFTLETSRGAEGSASDEAHKARRGSAADEEPAE
jgi:hypothetical protein